MSQSSNPMENPLSKEMRKKLLAVRNLYNYPIQFANPRFPVLSFVFAIYAGGEHTLYCDFFEDHAYEYLIKPYGISRAVYDAGGYQFMHALPTYLKPVWEALEAIYVRSKEGTVRTEANDQELAAFTAAILFELQRDSGPAPKW